MAEGYKQGIDTESLDVLDAALSEFIVRHPPGNPGLRAQLGAAEITVKRALEALPDAGSAAVGGAMALLEFLRATRGSRVPFTKPYPKA